MRRPRSTRRRAGLFFIVAVLAAAAPASAIAYWDFQGTLHDYPTVQYEYGELNPNVAGNWGHRLDRSNCEAKLLLRYRASQNRIQWNIPGGCDTSDYKLCYDASLYDASSSRNTDTGPGDVWVNVRVDRVLDDIRC